MQILSEGAAKIKVGDGVFYNPKMEKLRDISVLFLKSLGLERAKLLDSTTATGVRSIRYCLEAGIKKATAIDMNENAAKSAKLNARLNGTKIKVLNTSMQEFANTTKEAFDVIDIDPFGSPVPIIHDAFKVSRDGTVLMITATDTATLCGAEGKACLRIYGSKPLHNELCHEVGIRILLNFIAREAGQFNFGMEPMLSISDMHYFRVFVRLKHGSNESVKTISECGFGAYCNNCHAFSYRKGVAASINTKCASCGGKMNLFGQLWLGSLHDKAHVSKMLRHGNDRSSALQLLEKINGEIDTPFSYSIPKITAYLRHSSVPLDPIVALLNRKFGASRTHFEKDAIKTTAGIKDVMASVSKVKAQHARA